MKWKIPLYKITWDKDDILAVSKIIKRGMYWGIGPEIDEFERLLAEYVGTDYCLTFNSGTSAGHAALLTIGLKSVDEIIIPSFTFITTVNWALMVGAKPIFVDIEKETLGLNPDLIESSITKKTKLIIPMHCGGMPCHIEKIAAIAKKRKIFIIEDTAESLGAKIKNKKVGAFSDISVLSFAGNKIITTGEGGALVTNSKKLYDKLKSLRSYGRQINQNYFSSNEMPKYVTLGYNWRMSSVIAALGISQLSKLEKLITLRRRNAAYISSRINKYKNVQIFKEPFGYKNVYQLYSIKVPNSTIRNELSKFLAEKGIMSRIFFEPVHLTSYYKKLGYRNNKLPVTEKIYEQILTLPMYPGLKKEEMNFICDSVGEFMEKLNF
ncbi:MAG: DegT/DnrJ/EryC1/StrS family aminotransferase [Nitrososphaerota archaeon]